MHNTKIPVLGFAAHSGTGKTTLLTQLIPILKGFSLQVALIKHSHHSFEIDQPGKDSYRLRQAGATPVMLISSHRRAIMTEFESIKEPELEDQLIYFDQFDLDLILVEGFKMAHFPKIELHRPDLNKPLLFPNDPDIIAIASDYPIEITYSPCPVPLDINNPPMIAEFILTYFFKPTP